MIRMTQRQFRGFGRKGARLSENDIEKQITDFLRFRGWELTRQHVGVFVPLRVYNQKPETLIRKQIVTIGEKGQCDWLAKRVGRDHCFCEIFEWEAKRPGAKPSEDQLRYIDRRRALGWTCDWFDSLSNGGKKPLVEWYEQHFG